MQHHDSPALRHLTIIGFYLAVAVLMTWPVAAHLGDRIAGYPADNHLYVWTPWVFRQEVLSDLDPWHTTYIYYPDGISLALHALIVTKTIPGVLLLILFAVLTRETLHVQGPRWMLAPLALIYATTDLHGLLWHHLEGLTTLQSTPFYTMLMLWGMLAWLIVRRKRLGENTKVP